MREYIDRFHTAAVSDDKGWRTCRMSVHVLAALVLLAGTGLMIGALFTHYWQVAELRQLAFQQRYYGLYEICSAGGNRVITGTYGATCAYIDFTDYAYPGAYGPGGMGGLAGPSGFGGPSMVGDWGGGRATNLGLNEMAGGPAWGQNEMSGMTTAAAYPKGEKWRLATLVLVLLSIIFGLGAFVFCLCAYCARSSSIPWAVLNGFSSMCSLTAIAVFKRYAEDVTQKFILGATEVSEKFVGGSYHLASGATACFWFSGILAIVVALIGYLKIRHHARQGLLHDVHSDHSASPRHSIVHENQGFYRNAGDISRDQLRGSKHSIHEGSREGPGFYKGVGDIQRNSSFGSAPKHSGGQDQGQGGQQQLSRNHSFHGTPPRRQSPEIDAIDAPPYRARGGSINRNHSFGSSPKPSPQSPSPVEQGYQRRRSSELSWERSKTYMPKHVHHEDEVYSGHPFDLRPAELDVGGTPKTAIHDSYGICQHAEDFHSEHAFSYMPKYAVGVHTVV